MNDLGLALAWCAVQVSLLLIPAVVLYVLASRRSPDSGSWVGSLSLGLVVAISLLTFTVIAGVTLPTISRAIPAESVAIAGRREAPPSELGWDEGVGTGWSIAMFWDVWNRLEATAVVPAARCRPWGSALAVVALTGTGVGLLHLLIGLWAVHRCVRQSRPVDDPELNDLIEELRGLLGCRRRVSLRVASELTTPATAGWRRVFVLLPDDWRSWDEPERRAVLAHELAHVCRSDYATGVVARLALAIHFYHPLVHWLATRLQWEQELAADALGARFAGGRGRYLLSLSRLALRQDGRIPYWPARSFLPVKGNLIRRIAMLRDESLPTDRSWSSLRRGVSALLLLVVTAGVLTLQGPARGDDTDKVDDEVKTVKRVPQSDDTFKVQGEPFDLTYLPENVQGFVALRPAAMFGRAGMGTYRTMLNLLIAQQWSKAANAFGFDPAKPGLGPPRVEMVEQMMGIMTINQSSLERPRWKFMLGDVVSTRTTEPFDWVRLFRVFTKELTEAREGDRVYYKLNMPALGPDICFHCSDDRTIVFAGEKRMLQLLRRQTSIPPMFAKMKDWDRSIRGLFVAAFDSRDGLLGKCLQDADSNGIDIASPFKHAGLWTFGLDNGDAIAFNIVATFSEAGASESNVRETQTLIETLRQAASQPVPGAPAGKDHDRARKMYADLLNGLRVERDGQSVILRASGLGLIADFASLVAAGVIGL